MNRNVYVRGLSPLHRRILLTLANGARLQEAADKHGVCVATIQRLKGSKLGKAALDEAVAQLSAEECRYLAVRLALTLPLR